MRIIKGIKGVPRNGGRKRQPVWACSTLNSLHVKTLMLTDVQTPSLGTPLHPLKSARPRVPEPGGNSTPLKLRYNPDETRIKQTRPY